MDLSFHYAFCFRANRRSLEHALCASPISGNECVDDASIGLYRPAFASATEIFTIPMTDSRVLDAYDNFRLLTVTAATYDKDHAVVHVALSTKRAQHASFVNALSRSKQIARAYLSYLIDITTDWAYEKEVRYVDPQLGSAHEDKAILLRNFSETAVVHGGMTDDGLYEALAEYCGEPADASSQEAPNFMAGLSSNAITSINLNRLPDVLDNVVMATLNFAVVDYERRWARYSAEELLYNADKYSASTRRRLSDSLMRSRFSIQDAAPENYLDTGLEGEVYQRIWGAWKGESVMEQAASRCQHLESIFQNMAQEQQRRWEARITLAAFAITAVGLFGLYTDLYEYFTNGNVEIRVASFGTFFAVGAIAAVSVVRRFR